MQNDTINGPNLQQNEYLKVIKGNQEKHDSFLSNYLFLNKFTRNKTCVFTIAVDLFNANYISYII